MATAVQFQPRPSMDRAASFDQPRARSTPPFATQFDPRPQHSRTSSNSSSPYAQPFVGSNYFQGYQQPPNFPGQLPPGFHQQAEFAAWANAYHQMMASYQPADGRQRTSSGPSSIPSPTVSYAQAVSNSKQPVVSSRRSNPPNPIPVVRPRASQEITRSASNPSLGSQDHRRSSSNDSRPTARVSRQTSFEKPVLPVVSRSASPATSNKDSPSPAGSIRKASQPLYPGPITNATNQIAPSPLSQSTTEPEKKGFASKVKKTTADTTPKKQVTVIKASPSDTSTRSGTPPVTPPQDFSPPSAPFAVQHPTSLGSDVSLAETERTATATASKGKRSLFRMKNMSTDNISLSSTVSSASMMIRKMGSLGKLARRNSLMGISRIFKDKPKDEDAALPEREGKKKKKKKGKKGEASPPVVSPATVEASKEEEEDRTLVGLSPAAKLARQHTLRSRAEQAKREVTGEPAWDNDTTTRNAQQGNAQVLHIQPSRLSTVVHAVNVADHEYDSDEDSSDGETLEDVTAQMSKVRLSDDADREFRETWGNAYINRNAVPKKGILKSIASSEHLGATEDLKYDPFSPSFSPFDGDAQIYSSPTHNTSAPTLALPKPVPTRANTAPIQRRLEWAPSCAVYSTYDALTYDRRSEPATCNRLTPELAMAIKQELNAFKLEMPVHPSSRVHTHYFA